MPFPQKHTILLAFAATCLLSTGPSAYAGDLFPLRYTVVIDPGHGGVPRSSNDDKWDPVTERYIQRYGCGMTHGKYQEHEIVLPLAQRVRWYLKLTDSVLGWKTFRKYLTKFSAQKKFPRIRFNPYVSRIDGWKNRGLPPNHADVNAPYRLYDYPDPKKKNRMAPGRISIMNDWKPYLVLSLHLNPASRGHPGGMAAVLAPGYRTFNLIRLIALGKMPVAQFNKTPWASVWMIWDRGWNRFETARADAWVYFNGYRALKDGSIPTAGKSRKENYRGYRHNMFTWRYADPAGWFNKARLHGPGPYSMDPKKFRPVGRFWDRERGEAEHWRREDGPLAYGGDNHYAADELMRYIQFGSRILVPGRRKKGAMGEILKPFVSTYTMPTYLNAICPYIEVGHLNRERDRTLVIRDREAVAISLAVGIYSLFTGITPREGFGPYRPRGKPIDFKKYEDWKEGNYFEIVPK